MVKDNYVARVYSPVDDSTLNWDKQSRYYGGKDADGQPIEKVTTKPDMYELHYNEDPFHFEGKYAHKMMPEGTKMVPRVFKTNVGDHYTTNMVNLDLAAAKEDLMGKTLAPNEKGILSEVGEDATGMIWQVVKVYTLPDRQRAVKVLRIA
jgi:hypothetical protein